MKILFLFFVFNLLSCKKSQEASDVLALRQINDPKREIKFNEELETRFNSYAVEQRKRYLSNLKKDFYFVSDEIPSKTIFWGYSSASLGDRGSGSLTLLKNIITQAINFPPIFLILPSSDTQSDEVKDIQNFLSQSGKNIPFQLYPLDIDKSKVRDSDYIRDYFPVIKFNPMTKSVRLISTANCSSVKLNGKNESTHQYSRLIATAVENIYKNAGLTVERIEDFDFCIEGGNFLADTSDTCFTTEKTITYNSPEPDRVFASTTNEERNAIVEKMKTLLGCERVVFINSGKDDMKHVDTFILSLGENFIFYNPNPIEPIYQGGIQQLNIANLVQNGYQVFYQDKLTLPQANANAIRIGQQIFVPLYSEMQRGLYFEIGNENLKNLNFPNIDAYNQDLLGRLQKIANLTNYKIIGIESNPTMYTRGSFHCLSGYVPDVNYFK